MPPSRYTHRLILYFQQTSVLDLANHRLQTQIRVDGDNSVELIMEYFALEC